MQREFWLTMTDDTDVYVKKWYDTNVEPTAIVQLSHGMVEHINRYSDFATFLVNNNIFVYGNDHRGHGKTGDRQGQLGYLSDQNGFTKVTDDLFEITKIIKDEYPQTPLFLFGHSMGSFIARHYVQKYSHAIAGLILSGTGFFPTATSLPGKALASILPAKKESNIMNTLAFGTYNRKVLNKKTSFDWLTRADEAVMKYIDDPQTGYVPTARFFYDLMDGFRQIHHTKANENIRKDLPILFMSGDADPVGNYSKGVWKVANAYHQIGLNDIEVHIFEDGRHELLHELNQEEIYWTNYHWIIRNT